MPGKGDSDLHNRPGGTDGVFSRPCARDRNKRLKVDYCGSLDILVQLLFHRQCVSQGVSSSVIEPPFTI